MFAASSAWSLATPITAAPDEPTHIIKAAAVARGQFFGVPAPQAKYGRSALVGVHVPLAFARTVQIPGCFAFHPSIPASCAPANGPASRVVPAETYVGRYQPLYYLVVGIPSLLSSSDTGIRLMRLLSALICCVLLASAWESAAASRRRAIAIPAVVCAMTPMVFFLAGTVNPNSVEIAAAICLWMSGLVLVTESGATQSWRLVTRTGVAAAILVEMRGLSLLWFALIALVLLAMASKENLRRLLMTRAARIWAFLTAGSCVFALWWLFHYDALTELPGIKFPNTSFIPLLEANVGQIGTLFHEMIGVEGWLDTPTPALTFYLWGALIALAVGAGIMLGRRRHAIVLVVLIVAVIVVPIAIEVKEAPRIGFIWQGRYTLPLAVGVPMVAAFAVPSRASEQFVRRRMTVLLATVVTIAQLATFLWALRRYTVGLSGPVNPFRGTWSPPFGSIGVTVIFAVAMIAYGVAIVATGGSTGSRPFTRTAFAFRERLRRVRRRSASGSGSFLLRLSTQAPSGDPVSRRLPCRPPAC